VAVHLEPWGLHDLPLLTRLVGDPKMMEHLGGAESPEKIVDRHQRYLRHDAKDGRMFKIVDEETGKGVGSVGYWPRTWRGEEVYETGWSVLPEFQGRGIAAQATAQVIALARSENRYRVIHAFPSIDNGPSNAICRKLGFTLLGESDFEYPKGHVMRCNDWCLELRSGT
jgi:RimJ/RimL family protein N-acetyltransferase